MIGFVHFNAIVVVVVCRAITLIVDAIVHRTLMEKRGKNIIFISSFESRGSVVCVVAHAGPPIKSACHYVAKAGRTR